ncbi:MAG: hypothetical protein ACD_79C00705G0002 [uncultured bacterium]|nr:MAG: hypothetical protein ACD_79C00705G0002 [uncultured bacterium]
MKNKTKAFTLIEVMASLMVFAIGGAFALSVFNFNVANRILLDEKSEASLLATNILKTLVLQHQSGAINLTQGGAAWKYPATSPYKPNEDVYPRHDLWQFAVVPVQSWKLSGELEYKPITGANTYYTDYVNNDSVFEYGYCVIDNPQDIIEYNRLKDGWDTSPPGGTISMDSSYKMLTVAVTWPRTNPNKEERKRVVVSTLF